MCFVNSSMFAYSLSIISISFFYFGIFLFINSIIIYSLSIYLCAAIDVRDRINKISFKEFYSLIRKLDM